MGTYADDTVIINIAAASVQNHSNEIEERMKKSRFRANESKSVQITFTPKKDPPLTINNITLPQAT